MNNLVISSYLILALCSYNGPKPELFHLKNRPISFSYMSLKFISSLAHKNT